MVMAVDKGVKCNRTLHLQNITDAVNKQNIDLASIKSDIKHVRTDVEGLVKIIRDGNGRGSLMERVAIVESKTKSIGKSIRTGKDRGWSVMVAVIGGLIGVSGGLVALLK